MRIEIRPLVTHDEYRAVERLQHDVWGLEEVEIVPDHLLITAHKNGGMVLGAFDSSAEGERMIGFVFGFVGLDADGRVKHCSHMTGVLSDLRDRNIGHQLKLAQREWVLAQGMDLITWTFDPLESRNARLNFRKLGAVCCTYLRDVYGGMRDSLNVGLASDRFQVDWHITSSHVSSRLTGETQEPLLTALLDAGVTVVNKCLPGDPLCPPEDHLPFESHQHLIQIPPTFQAIKKADMGLARAWRLHSRALFESAFAQGYTVIDLLFTGGASFYLLQKGWSPFGADESSPSDPET